MRVDLSRSAGYQVAHREAIDAGLRAIGVHDLGESVLIIWGWRAGALHRKAGKEVLVLERGYIGDRFKYTSIGWNGLNGYAHFPECHDDGGARFRAHGGKLKPWKEGGDYILILGQVNGDASLQGRNITTWYQQMAAAAKARYGKPVYFRMHPKAAIKGYKNIAGVPSMAGDLHESIDGALFTIAYNSNACLDSVMAGVPCFAGDRGTMAWDLCAHDMKEIIRPDRECVVHRIAWTQWELSEIASGVALRGVAGHV